MSKSVICTPGPEGTTLRIDKEDLPKMNESELVHICRLAGLRVGRDTPKEWLIACVTDNTTDYAPSEIDEVRDSVMEFLEAHLKILKPQLKLSCDGDCYKHHDGQVLLCWLVNQQTIERYQEARHGKEGKEV